MIFPGEAILLLFSLLPVGLETSASVSQLGALWSALCARVRTRHDALGMTIYPYSSQG